MKNNSVTTNCYIAQMKRASNLFHNTVIKPMSIDLAAGHITKDEVNRLKKICPLILDVKKLDELNTAYKEAKKKADIAIKLAIKSNQNTKPLLSFQARGG